MNKDIIESMIKDREVFLKNNEDDSRIDEISKTITTEFRKNGDLYEVDFILECLTKFGEAPNLVYDDNGLFAVSGAGYQPVVSGREKIHGPVTVFVDKKQWKKTIRAALKHYLKP